ncbi:MAG: hypothetical protein AUF67_16065 [Acidobacteria bacterium 13_1_20CM_58_21]|nr:MAG: hypothetical protein AUF67_16065 [Acidobacteria bacterium 13_1_20CM_58_21]
MAAFALIAVSLMVGYAQPITAQGGMSGHPMDMREAVPPEKLPPPLKLTGIGNAHIHITATPEAQMWLDQGLNLLHDFWDYWNYVHNLMYAIANLMEAGQLSEATALSGKLRDARGQLANTLYPWSPRDAMARLDPRLLVALRAADWAAALGLLKSSDLPRAEAASAEFDAELWRLSNRLKDEADAQANEKDTKTAEAAPPKLQVMPDALPKPLLNNLSILSLELRGGLFMAKKLTGDAKKLYAQAAQEERALGYREPPAYIRPVGETEAAAFMAASDWTDAKAAYREALVERPRGLPAVRHGDGQRAGWRHQGGHGSVRGLFGGVEIRRFRSSATRSCALSPRLSQRSRRQQIAVQISG